MILAKAKTTANTNVVVYTVPTNRKCNFSMNIVNTSGSVATIRIAFSTTTSVNIEDYIEYGYQLAANTSLVRTDLSLDSSYKIIVYSSVANCAINIIGDLK